MDVKILCSGYHQNTATEGTSWTEGCNREVALFTCEDLNIISGNFLQQNIFDDEATLRIDGLLCDKCADKFFNQYLEEQENAEPDDSDLPDADDYDQTPTEIEALTEEIQELSEKVEDSKVDEDRVARNIINKIKGGLSNNLRGEVCAELKEEYREKIKKDVIQEIAVEIERNIREKVIDFYQQELARILRTFANGINDKLENISSPLIKDKINNRNMKRVLDL